VRDARITAPVAGTDLPLVALDAYLRAAGTMATDKPACGVQWQMLAALGRIESRHGNINGATLRPDGRATLPIIGIALTGEDGTALVPDTDEGALDGDDQLDRAVGPMQFIPSTWYSFRRDGNGDRVSDPQNLYDAALAAAAYLCAGTRTLTTTEGLRAAYLSYNRSTSYVNTAVDNLDRYRRLVVPPVPKVR
jgi:membrane-bound lytic murein transglycosylase B